MVYKGFMFKKADTPMHRLDPRVKFLLAIAFLVCSLLFEEFLALAALTAALIPLAWAGRVLKEWLQTLKGLGFLAVFIFAVNLVFIFFGSGKPWEFPAAMALRFVVVVSAFSLFFLVTSPDEFGLALQQSKIPFDIVFALTMAIRFVPVLALEIQSIVDAQRSKGLELDRGNILVRIKRRIPLLVPLIVSSVKRSLEIAEAMEARGYGSGRPRTSLYQLKFKFEDHMAVAAVIAAIALSIYIRLQIPVPVLRF
ncbi:MAG: energy-coupling factor transporter transmembrane component T family protein [Candidatus Hecatellaceae archaeon]